VFFSLTPEAERRLAAAALDLRSERDALARIVAALRESSLADEREAERVP
jgi:hypothetical protein